MAMFGVGRSIGNVGAACGLKAGTPGPPEAGIPLVNLGISCGIWANHPPSLGIKGGGDARMIPA
jgi:hypothetical protein